MKLQIATRHALLAVLELATQAEHHMSASEIADKYGISPSHLAKVLRTLGREGLVEAARGVGGGYRFAANAKRHNLLEIIRIFESIGSSATDDLEGGDDTPEGQALRIVFKEIEDTACATLSSITIETMLKLVNKINAKRATTSSAREDVSRKSSARK